MKVYYFLNDISDKDYEYFIKKLELLKSSFSSDNLIEKFFYKVGEKNGDGVINYGFFPEALKFIDYYSDKYNLSYSQSLKKIVWVHNDFNFYIYGEDIYISKLGTDSYRKLNANNKVAFVSSRDCWLSPFFLALYKISEINKNINVFRPNKREGWIYNDDKINNIFKLYNKNIDILGKILVPYILNINFQSIEVLLNSVKNKLGRKVVLKRNASQSGDGIKMLDIEFYNKKENLEALISRYFSFNTSSIFSIYFVPYYEIKREYRAYYIYNKKKGKVKIYTVKNRENTCETDIFTNIDSNYSLNKDVIVRWSCMSYEDWNGDKKLRKTISKVGKSLGYNKGVIELILTTKDELIYSEYNSLGGPLMFKEDQDKMQEYFYDIWKIGMKDF